MVKTPLSEEGSKTEQLQEIGDLSQLPDLQLVTRRSLRISHSQSPTQDLIQSISKKRDLNQTWVYVDFDNFSVNCHLLKNPQDRMKPCVVIRTTGNGNITVLSSNDVARKKVSKKVRSIEPYKSRFGDELKIFEEDKSLQYDKSKCLKDIAFSYDPFFQNQGGDEACINITSWVTNKTDTLALVRKIKNKVEEISKLKVSCGVGATSYLAKMAANDAKLIQDSSSHKIFVVNSDITDIRAYLGEKDVIDFHDIGDAFALRLNSMGIFKGRDILLKAKELDQKFTKTQLTKFIHYALGVESSSAQKSKTKTSQAEFYAMETKQQIQKQIIRLVQYFQNFLKKNCFVTNKLSLILWAEKSKVESFANKMSIYSNQKEDLMESISGIFQKIRNGMNLTKIEMKCPELLPQSSVQLEHIPEATKTKRIKKPPIKSPTNNIQKKSRGSQQKDSQERTPPRRPGNKRGRKAK